MAPTGNASRDGLKPALRPLAAVLLALTALAAGAEEDPAAAPRGVAGLAWVGFGPVDPWDPSALDHWRRMALEGLGPALVTLGPIPWGRIEPRPPIGGDRRVYDWERVDAVIRSFTAAGFEVVPRLSASSPWASAEREQSGWARALRVLLPAEEARPLRTEGGGALPPAENHWRDWEAFVRAFLERYDGDGFQDAPGLGLPVRAVELEDRPVDPRRFAGDASEYLRLLHHASQAAELAARTNDQRPGPAAPARFRIRVVHGAVDLLGLGAEPYPDDPEVERRLDARLGDLPPAAALASRWTLDFARQTLEMTRLVDVVPHLGSAHGADEVANLRWLRHLLDSRGGATVEAWLTDTPLAHLGEPQVAHSARPGPDEARLRSRLAAAARNPAHPDRGPARAWFDRGEAYDLVRTIARARAAGARRILWDAEGPASTSGRLVRRSVVGDWQRLPAWHALAQANGLLAGRTIAEVVSAGAPASAVRFSSPALDGPPPVTIVFLDPDLSWAGDADGALPARDVALAVADGAYVIEEVALAAGEPTRRRARAEGGVLRLALTPAPVYLTPER
jgi:hypothetical protein